MPDDFHDVVLAMFAVAISSVMLVAGALYLVSVQTQPIHLPQTQLSHDVGA